MKMEEIEEKLLKGCKTKWRSSLFPNTHYLCGEKVPNYKNPNEVMLCPECRAKLVQHKETK